jgi:hypothetical protein
VQSRNMTIFMEWQTYQATRPDRTSEEYRRKLLEAFQPDFQMMEPPSLPFGGLLTGPDEYLAMRDDWAKYWDSPLTDHHVWELPEQEMIIKYSTMEFTAHSTGRTVRLPSVQLVWFRDGRMARVEVFIQDAALALGTLEPAQEAT